MTRKTIAVDIDDVLAASAPGFVEFSNKKWGTSLRPEDYHDHWALLWGIESQEAVERDSVMASEGVFKGYSRIDKALPVLKTLSQKYTLIVVTARRIISKDDTHEWIDKHFPGIFNKIHFAGIWEESLEHAHQKGKGAILKDLGADYLIDDQLKHCISAAELGIKGLVFGNYTWNQSTELPDGVTRVLDWPSIEEYFEKENR